jgi:two-component system sensor histidine kinase/response regulator
MTFTLHDTTELAIELPSVPGLDVVAGLRCVQGRRERYVELLRLFVADQQGTLGTIRQALAKADWPLATRTAHSCKSVAATVGASSVANLAADLEAMFRCQQPADEAVQALEQALYGLLAAIRAWLGSRSRPGQAVVADATAPACQQSVAHLVELLGADDARAAEYMRQHGPALRGALPQHFDGLQAAVWDFDFPRALRIVSDAGDRRCGR